MVELIDDVEVVSFDGHERPRGIVVVIRASAFVFDVV